MMKLQGVGVHAGCFHDRTKKKRATELTVWHVQHFERLFQLVATAEEKNEDRDLGRFRPTGHVSGGIVTCSP